MRAYHVVVGSQSRYAGTQSDATAARNAMLEGSGVMKKNTKIDEVDIPTSKPELLAFINSLVDAERAKVPPEAPGG